MPENEKPPQTVEEMFQHLARTFTNGMQAIATRVGDLEGTVNKRCDDLEDRVDDLHVRVTNVEVKRAGTSLRVREVANLASSNDLSHDAKIANEVEARERVEAKLDRLLSISTRLDSLSRRPMVRHFFLLLGMAIMAWLASHGVRLPG